VAMKNVVSRWCKFIATAFMPWLIKRNKALTLVNFLAPGY